MKNLTLTCAALALLVAAPLARADVIFDLAPTTSVSGGGTTIWAAEIMLASSDPIESITTSLSDSVAGPVTMTCFIFDGDGDASTTPGALLGTASITTDFPSSFTDFTFDFGGLAVPTDGFIVVGFNTDSPMGRAQEAVFTSDPAPGPAPSVGTYIVDWTGDGSPSGWSNFFGDGLEVPVAFTVESAAVPEPSSLLMLALGAGVAGMSRRRRNATPVENRA